MATRKGKRWTQKVTEESNALDLEAGVFALKDPSYDRALAQALGGAEQSAQGSAFPLGDVDAGLLYQPRGR